MNAGVGLGINTSTNIIQYLSFSTNTKNILFSNILISFVLFKRGQTSQMLIQPKPVAPNLEVWKLTGKKSKLCLFLGLKRETISLRPAHNSDIQPVTQGDTLTGWKPLV